MSKLVQLFLLALAGLGMASASLAADPKFNGFMQTVSGNKTTVSFGTGGVPIATSSAPLGTPSIGAMGFTKTSEGVFMESIGQARLSTGGTVPVETRLKLSAGVLAKSLAKAAVVVTLWEAGSDLYNIWGSFGLSRESNGQIRAGSGAINQTQNHASTVGTWRAIASNGYPFTYQNTTAYGACNAVQSPYSGVLNGDQCTTAAYPSIYRMEFVGSPSCPSGSAYNAQSLACESPNPALTADQIENHVANILANEGWPSTGSAAAVRDALALAPVQPLVIPDIEAQPQSDTKTKVVGIPEGVPFQVGDPVTKNTTRVRPDGMTEEIAETTSTTATAIGNTIQTQQQTSTTTTVKDATGAVVSTSTATTVQDKTATTAADGEDLECGLPGTPPCKIDETDTPEPPDPDEDGWKQLFAPLQECIDDLEACLPELPEINLTFSFPSHCGSIPTPGFAPYFTSINICQYQGMFHDLMSMLWAAAGVFGAMSIVGRNPFR